MDKHGGDAEAFAKLLSRLIRAYPRAVKVTKSEQQEAMERLMRDMDAKPPPRRAQPPAQGESGAEEEEEAEELDAEEGAGRSHDEM